jgi:hypothetical protein
MIYANLPQPFGEVRKSGDYDWVALMRVTENAPWSIYCWCKDEDFVDVRKALNKLFRQGRVVETMIKATIPAELVK